MALLAALGAVAAIGLSAQGATEDATAQQAKPNIVVVMTDDQTLEAQRVMSTANRRIGERGATFKRYYDNFALCCPTRATLLTGQYAHNHQVLGNGPPRGGYERFHTLPPPNDEANTLPSWLQDEGYYTGLIGKYLNGYEDHADDAPPLVPPGWTEWRGLADFPYLYYGYRQVENFYDGALHGQARVTQHGSAPADYSTDRLFTQAADFVGRRAATQQPFFLWLTPLAPHSGGPNPSPQPPADCPNNAKPAPRHTNAFDAEPLPMPPSFNELDVTDKPLGIQTLPPLTPLDVDAIRRSYRCELESLLAVDEGVGRLLDALKASGELDRTLVIFVSDNGFFHGEHRVNSGKERVYEESTRLPLLMRGPGIPAGGEVRDLASSADLAPTILEAAGATAGREVDGRSLLPAAQDPVKERGRELVIEHTAFQAIHTRRYLYAVYTGGVIEELYDLDLDPYQLRSEHANPAYADVRAALRARLVPLRNCAKPSCLLTPDLGLALSPGPGGACHRREQQIRVAGGESGLARLAEFYVGGALKTSDATPPLQRTLRLPRGRNVNLRVRATLLDGRRKTLATTIRTCG